jgi:hypothetical protein
VDQTVTQDVEAIDIDKDGDLDLVLGNEDENRIYVNNGKGVFTDETAARLPSAGGVEETRKVDVADVDGDGDEDLFFSNVRFRPGKNPANRLLINNGKGVFTDETVSRFKADNSRHTADADFVDLNGDKAPDLVMANLFGGEPQVLLNDGKGYFSDHTTKYLRLPLTSEAISVEVLDANKDGLPDLYFGIFRGTDLLLYGER